MFDSFNFKAKSQGGHLMPVVVGWCHHAVHARSMAGKYLRFLKRLTDSTAGKSGKSVRKVFPLLTWIFSRFGVEHPTTRREIMWWNHERKGFSTPLAKQIEVAIPNGLENAFFRRCCGKTNNRRTQLNYQHFLGFIRSACRMSTTLKTHSLGKKNLWVWKRRIFLKQLYGHHGVCHGFVGEPSTWWIPKISDMEPLETPIIQEPTCFSYQQLRETNIKYFT